MLNTPLIALLSVLAASLFGALGQYVFQHAAAKSVGGTVSALLNPWVIAGITCYALVMVLFMYGFKSGGSVRVLYPIYASTFIWAALIASLFYHDPIRPLHVAGMLLLVTGIICMSW